jgi:hypothetical protein
VSCFVTLVNLLSKMSGSSETSQILRFIQICIGLSIIAIDVFSRQVHLYDSPVRHALVYLLHPSFCGLAVISQGLAMMSSFPIDRMFNIIIDIFFGFALIVTSALKSDGLKDFNPGCLNVENSLKCEFLYASTILGISFLSLETE